MSILTAPAVALLVFAAILILMMVKSVPQGEHWTVERLAATPAPSIRGCASSSR